VAIVNDDRGRALRDWILFAVGICMVVALTAVWIVTGRQPDVSLIGLACVILGYGNILLARNGNGNGGPK